MPKGINFLLPPYRSFPLRPDLPAMPQKMIREHAGHHGLADRHGADADARVVTAFCRDVGLAALATVLRGDRIDDVGFTAKRATTGWPVEMPPRPA